MIFSNVPITYQIALAAVKELYCLKEMTATDSLVFFQKYGVHFYDKKDIEIEASNYRIELNYHLRKHKQQNLNNRKFIKDVCKIFNTGNLKLKKTA